ncbi:Heart- and neural crest derivatives-expressed protein 2 [Armadillidium nasatum]|uniref:Heart-and neural crest derivatives-expressed protein 2 n=1 Tax=Armadillidium nasatum TaxID=96803 RepID=A0A5N5T7X3_9CRUS|nr:Heart- and neural crest derivatives-expressed protein 2 [Armadillidium nasatum]
MSIVGGYPMPQNYGHATMGPTATHDNLYYYSHPSPPTHQHYYPGWGTYPTPYPSDMTGCTDYGVPPGSFVVGPGSPQQDFSGGEYTIEMVDGCGRVIKRRTSANKKERRRTQSINNAFAELRECIPNVPADTKLSKIKTLRLATSYIAYLMGVLRTDVQDAPTEAFKAELPPKNKTNSSEQEKNSDSSEGERAPKKGRTGWPQAVWAQELKK